MSRICPATGQPCPASAFPACAGPEDGTCSPRPTPRLLKRSRALSSIRHGWPAPPRREPPAPIPPKGDRPRVGLDVLALQSKASRERGIGRYAGNLVSALTRLHPETEFILYTRGGLPTDRLPRAGNVFVRSIPGEVELATEGNPEGLDALLLLSPYESHVNGRCPVPTVGAVVYDLIHDRLDLPYRHSAEFRDRCEAYLAAARGWRRLLAISEATRRDFVEGRGFEPERVVNIGGGVEGRFTPGPSREAEAGPYVLHVGGNDDRKGGHELIRAFGRLPEGVRRGYRLVYACELSSCRRREFADVARAHGVRLEMLGYVSDARLVDLYRGATITAFPSKAEGLGLPILESIACGVPVVHGGNTSQPEAAGPAGLACDPTSPDDIARAVAEGLDPEVNTRLRGECPGQIGKFSWDRTARLAMEALGMGELSRASATMSPMSTRRPRIAHVSPWPPYRSGVADYAARLTEVMRGDADLTLVADRPVDLPATIADLPVLSPAEFEAAAAGGAFDAVLYQMGNNGAHIFVADLVHRVPGVVAIHDLDASGPFLESRDRPGVRPIPGSDPADALARVCRAATRIVVHARCNLDAIPPDCRGKAAVVPFGASPNPKTPGEIAAIRAAHGIPAGDFILGVGGIISTDKLSLEAIAAFALCMQRGALPPHSRLLFIGPDVYQGQQTDGQFTRDMAAATKFAGRITFAGDLDPDAFADLEAACDVGITLRMPPTRGETSAALFDFLRAGVPTIVLDTGTFTELPDEVACKVAPDGLERPWRGLAGLVHTMYHLWAHPHVREGMGRAALEHVRANHGWSLVARRYAELLGVNA